MLLDQQILDDPSADQMLLDYPLERRRVAFAVPRALGIDDCYRAAFTDPEAIHLRAKYSALIRQAQVGESLLQELPGFHAARQVAAFWLRLLGAKEDVAARDGHANRLGNFTFGVAHAIWREYEAETNPEESTI